MSSMSVSLSDQNLQPLVSGAQLAAFGDKQFVFPKPAAPRFFGVPPVAFSPVSI